MNRKHVTSGTPWESSVGYCRAVRVGNQIFVSGTTATDDDGNVVAAGDAYQQTRYVLAKIDRALKELDASPANVVRTRMFVTDISRWQEFGRAHGEVFSNIRPAATMVQVAALIDPEHLVEIEVDAIADEP